MFLFALLIIAILLDGYSLELLLGAFRLLVLLVGGFFALVGLFLICLSSSLVSFYAAFLEVFVDIFVVWLFL